MERAHLIPDDLTNLDEAIMSSDCGTWFLVPKDHVDTKLSTTCVSVIVHKCPKWTPELLSPNQKPYEPLGYWTAAESMEVGCKLCDVHPPEIIVHPWLLHNFDTFADAPTYMSRVITREISKSWSRGLHRYALYAYEDPCPCRECRERYGEEL